MYTWVIYDISDNRNRRRVGKLCKQAGLRRVQKSVFLGKISANILRELQVEVEPLVDAKDRLFFVPMNESEYGNMVLMGEGFDKRRVGRGYSAMFY